MNQLVNETVSSQRLDSGLCALCGIAGFFRIAADPELLGTELALTRSADASDLLRAAIRVGLRARLVTDLDAARLAKIPTPAILQMNNGLFVLFAGQSQAGLWRIIDPITRFERSLPLEALFDEIVPNAVLVGRRWGGPGIDPRGFSLRWFLPSIWRYR